MKSTRTYLIALAITLATATLLCGTTSGREVRCKLLQQKLGRLYFSAGKEEDIFPGCRWVVYRDSTDTLNPLLHGKIAESYDGVSVSDSSSLPDIGTWPDSASVEPAPIAHGQIRVVGFIDSLLYVVKSDLPSIDTNVSGKPVLIDEDSISWPGQWGRTYLREVVDSSLSGSVVDSISIAPLVGRIAIQSTPRTDNADILISYRQTDEEIGRYQLSHSAPFLVGLLSRVAKRITRGGLLTTALFYRVDSSNAGLIFGSPAISTASFIEENGSVPSYAPDSKKGKALLKEVGERPAAVCTLHQSPFLNQTLEFLNEILHRGGFFVCRPLDPADLCADLQLEIIPFESVHPERTLQTVLSILAADTVVRDKSNQPIRLADRLLTDAMQTSDSTQRMRLLQRVDRILMEDIGAFPLFRPIIHICAKEEIRGIRFDKDGRIDLRNVYRVKLPADSTSSSP